MREEEAFVVFRITNSIVEQIPVQSIDSGIARVTTRAALPPLKADARVMEVELAFAQRVPFSLGQHEWFCLQSRMRQINHGQRVREIVRGVCLRANHSDGAWPVIPGWQFDALSKAHQEREVVNWLNH
jgi:hypothetical protein